DQRRREVAGEFLRGPHRVSRRGRGDRLRFGTSLTTLSPKPKSAVGGGQVSFLFLEILMTMRSWARNLFTRPVTRPIRKEPPGASLAVEALEDRWVPSTLTVNS